MESEVDLQNEKIRTKPHDLFNLKRVSVDLFAFLGFGTFREYSSYASKFSLETGETFIIFCFIFISFKKKAERPLQSHDPGGNSSKESTKDSKSDNKNHSFVRVLQHMKSIFCH